MSRTIAQSTASQSTFDELQHSAGRSTHRAAFRASLSNLRWKEDRKLLKNLYDIDPLAVESEDEGSALQWRVTTTDGSQSATWWGIKVLRSECNEHDKTFIAHLRFPVTVATVTVATKAPDDAVANGVSDAT